MTRTNAYSILCVMVRATSLWMSAQGLIAIAGGLMMTTSPDMQRNATFAWVTGGLVLLFALIFWTFAEAIAGFACRKERGVVFESDFGAEDWYRLAFAVVGLWQLINAAISLVDRLGIFILLQVGTAPDGYRTSLPGDYWVNVATECLRLAIGVALLLGARGLSGMLRSMREVGHYPASESKQDAAAAADEKTAPEP